jgi:hypothetical protein
VINAILIVDHCEMGMFQIAKFIVPNGPFVADFVLFRSALAVRSVPPAVDCGLRVVLKG